MNEFETLLAHMCALLIPLAESFVEAPNPELAPVIGMLGTGIQNELASIASGNKPTLASAVETVAPGILVTGAALVAKNNPAYTQQIASVVSTIAQAIPSPAVTPIATGSATS